MAQPCHGLNSQGPQGLPPLHHQLGDVVLRVISVLIGHCPCQSNPQCLLPRRCHWLPPGKEGRLELEGTDWTLLGEPTRAILSPETTGHVSLCQRDQEVARGLTRASCQTKALAVTLFNFSSCDDKSC